MPRNSRRNAARHLASLARTARRAAALGLAANLSAHAAARTIAHRSRNIRAAAADPFAPHDPELSRMVTEKVVAGLQAGFATAAALSPLHQATLRWSGAQWRIAAALAASLARARTPAEAMSAQARYLEASAALAAAIGIGLLGHWLRIGARAGAPFNRAIAANDRRLGRRR